MDHSDSRERDRSYGSSSTPSTAQPSTTPQPTIKKFLPWMKQAKAAPTLSKPSNVQSPTSISHASTQQSSHKIQDSANNPKSHKHPQLENIPVDIPTFTITEDPLIPFNSSKASSCTNETISEKSPSIVSSSAKPARETTKCAQIDAIVLKTPLVLDQSSSLSSSAQQTSSSNNFNPFLKEKKNNFANADHTPAHDEIPPIIGRDVTLRISDRMGVKLEIKINTTKRIYDLKKIISEKTGRRNLNLSKARIILQDQVTLMDYGLTSDGINLELT